MTEPIQETFTRPKENRLTPIKQGEFRGIPSRGLSPQTTERYGVTVTDTHAIYPLFDLAGNHVADKKRTFPKEFSVVGHLGKAGVFGRHAFPPGGKTITITEGQDDAMAVYEMFGRKYPAVSVHSAQSAVKDVNADYEYLNSFESIYICFDNDSTKETNYGQEAAQKVAERFALGKVHIVTLREHKDANEYLIANQGKQFVAEWWASPVFTPEGLKVGSSLWDEVKEISVYESCDLPYATLTKMTYGLRLTEMVVVTADTGVGKTSFIKEIEYFVLKNTPETTGVGFIHLEESTKDTCLGIMSISANKPLHLPDVRQSVSEDELKTYFDDTVNNDRVVIWDHFGSNSLDKVIAKIRHMNALGCKYIVLDHLSILVAGNDEDDRKALDRISTELKSLCMELSICLICVIQQNRSGQIRGSAGVEHVANAIIKLSRNKLEQDDWRRNVTELTIEKNRFSGRTGPAGFIYYDNNTGRLEELDEDQSNIFRNGGTVGESWT